MQNNYEIRGQRGGLKDLDLTSSHKPIPKNGSTYRATADEKIEI